MLHKPLLGMLLVLTLAGCGFHLNNINAQRALCITADDENLLMRLTVRLHAVCNKKANRLAILSMTNDSTLVSMSANNNIRQFVLIKRLQYQLSDKTGNTITPIITLSAQKPLTINNNRLLSTSLEKQVILNEMTDELITQLKYRLKNNAL